MTWNTGTVTLARSDKGTVPSGMHNTRREPTGPLPRNRLLRPEIRLAHRAALGLRRLRRGIHARRRVLEPRRRRDRSEGHDREAEARQSAAPRDGNTGRHDQSDRPEESW